jgi:hypothetical protein
MSKWSQIKMSRSWCVYVLRRGKEASFLNPSPLRTSCAQGFEFIPDYFGPVCLKTWQSEASLWGPLVTPYGWLMVRTEDQTDWAGLTLDLWGETYANSSQCALRKISMAFAAASLLPYRQAPKASNYSS